MLYKTVLRSYPYIFDKKILEKIDDKTDHRVTFIHETLQNMNAECKRYSSSLVVRYGDPEKLIPQLAQQYDAQLVYCNKDYEPYARVRDKAIHFLLEKKNIEFKSFKDHLVFEPGNVVKDNGEPYMVYTPFKHKWLKQFIPEMILRQASETRLTKLANIPYQEIIDLGSFGFKESAIKVSDYVLDRQVFSGYKENRDYPDREFGVSRISPYLRFGQLSTREAFTKAMDASCEHFVSELIWREFFQHVLWYFPNSKRQAIKPAYDRMEWSKDKKHFQAWCQGKTGYSIVDAGMRELNATGYMHNRIRMVTASFLCKHLQIDWRWGEEYFAKKLFDYEMASNVGNWQWVAGSGTDTMPYFRIFNPYTQREKFDTDSVYIKKWISEFETAEYPDPIVEHKAAREKTIAMYKKALGK